MTICRKKFVSFDNKWQRVAAFARLGMMKCGSGGIMGSGLRLLEDNAMFGWRVKFVLAIKKNG
jgi:hypothetical protein